MGTRRGLCLVIAAPSGAGKSSLARALLAAEPGLAMSVSATTRAPRNGETDGEHYYFVTHDAFAAMAARGEFLEHATVFGRSYGTPRAPVIAALEQGRDILFDIDWQGFRQVRQALPGDVVGVALLPPSLAVLRARLLGRGDPAEAVDARMAQAGAEMSHWREFDYAVVNDDFDVALGQMRAILIAARCATGRVATD